MEIIVGKNAGFCYGVKRAVQSSLEDTKSANKNLFCLGELVHNKRVVNELKNKGIKFINNIEETEGTTIIRAHGVPNTVYKYCKQNNIDIKDYTCPNVLKIHEIAEEYSKKGYYIFLLGSKNHPENIGTISFCGDNLSVIEKEEQTIKEIERFEKTGMKKILVISQTTYSLEKFYIIEEIINNEIKKDVEIIVKNTICNATEVRQKETEEISKIVDYMIIIGGKNSSNTKKLYDIASKNCKTAVNIESAEELDLEEIIKYNKIGIMAGASTPQISIDEVICTIENY